MNIKCDPDVFKSDSERNFFISCMVSHNKSHSLDVGNIDELLEHHNLSDSERNLMLRLAVHSAYSNYSLKITISNTHTGNGIFPCEQLNDILSRKAVIILENEFSDARFIESVIKSQNKDYLLKTKDISWEFCGAGGCGEIPKHIRSKVEKMKNLKRILVVHDSDKLHPDSEISEIQRKIIEQAKEYDIFCYTLEKREIENYIPDEIIYNIDWTRKKIIESFSKLSSTQKDFFDYKLGFKKRGGYKKKNDTSLNGLYEDIDDEVYNEIKNGFGKEISDAAYNEHVRISKDDFSLRCDNINHEFFKICEAIEKIL
ncbi:hypothetical protein [Pantoea sp. OXWO6B1]|uniref:hypothetical protein n=1 Tax=Pantoea sp. OXWO6B1 TaxID=1835724 RepID=UPI0007C68B0A|nr:hypothetical protein [Pantoea sp. OXWO6B1]OAE09888.1 hypothetical protein A6A26_20805 [Pantoea sp. OXWO6B1]